MSNPFRYSKRKRTLNRPKYDEEPPPITKSTFMNKYLPLALLNSWITCDTLGCYNVPAANFGPFTESGEYTTGVSSNGESKILVQIPRREYQFTSNGDFYIDNDAGAGSHFHVNVPSGGSCNYQQMDFVTDDNQFIFTGNVCLSAGSTVTFNGPIDECFYRREDLLSDQPLYTFPQDVALAAGSTIAFTGGTGLYCPIPIPILGVIATGRMDLCPLEYYSFNDFMFLPEEMQSIDVTNAANSYLSYMVLVECFPDMIAFRLYRNDVDMNPIPLALSDHRQFALFGSIRYDEMPDDLYISFLSRSSNNGTFLLSSGLVRKDASVPSETVVCFSTNVCQLVYDPDH